jgi:hypothetical protein
VQLAGGDQWQERALAVGQVPWSAAVPASFQTIPKLIARVADTPLLATAGGVLARVFVMERVADAVRVIKQRTDDELGDCGGDFLREAGELPLGTRTNVEMPAPASIGHAAPVLWNR